MAEGRGDEHVARAVHRHAGRVGELWADGVDGPVGQHLLDSEVAGVGDEHVALVVHRHAVRIVEPGADGPEEGTAGRVLIDVANAVGDEHIALVVHRHAVRLAKPGADGLKESPARRVLLNSCFREAAGDEHVARRCPTATSRGRCCIPEPKVVWTVGANVGSVEYWNWTVVLTPSGLTEASSVAPVAVTGAAVSLVTAGAGTVVSMAAVPSTVPPALVATAR